MGSNTCMYQRIVRMSRLHSCPCHVQFTAYNKLHTFEGVGVVCKAEVVTVNGASYTVEGGTSLLLISLTMVWNTWTSPCVWSGSRLMCPLEV